MDDFTARVSLSLGFTERSFSKVRQNLLFGWGEKAPLLELDLQVPRPDAAKGRM